MELDGLMHILSVDFNNPDQKWVLIGLGVAFIIYFIVIKPMRKKKDPLARSPVPSTLAQHRSVERDMSNLLVELSDMARQTSAQLDTRAAKLELLIREADEKIAILRSTLDAPGPADQALRNVIRSTPSETNFSSMVAEPPHHSELINALEETDPRHTEIYQLADDGRSSIEIAQALGRPTGEIELILALRPKP